MSILAKLFPGNVEAEKLEAEIAENSNLRTELATAQAKIDELQNLTGEIAMKDLKITDLTAKVDEITAQITAKDAEITKLTEAATATTEKISIEAARQLASSGHPTPIANTPDADTDDKIMSRAAFNSLTPAARLKFVKAGGKIS
jgi:septal ring factor EnvC (AmiA/AmiB activator)